MKKVIFTIFVIVLFQINIFAQDTIYLNISASAAYDLVQTNENNPQFVILDIRTLSEYNTDHIVGSTNIDYYSTTFSSDLDALDKSKIYLLHCASGGRSANAFIMMQDKHFREVYNLLGGFNAWKNAGYPTYLTVGVEDIVSNENVQVYPNPASDYINISVNETEYVEIYNTIGSLVMSKQISNGDKIDLHDFSKGLYFIKVSSENKLLKFIVN